jgi:acyl-CoA dehydrogenase
MDFSFNEEQRDLAGLAAEVFPGLTDTSRTAALEQDSVAFDTELWSGLAKTGLLGTVIGEEFGGLGLGFVEACIVLSEMGRCTPRIPLWSHTLAALVIGDLGTQVRRCSILPGMASGNLIVATALPGSQATGSGVTALPVPGGWRLDGSLRTVVDAPCADLLLVSARTAEGLLIAVINRRTATGLEVRNVSTVGHWPAAHLVFDRVGVGETDVLTELSGPQAETLRQKAVVGLCALHLGVIDEALRRTAEYTSGRQVFGRPVAAFQSAALRMADCVIDLESMRVTTWQAAWLLAEGLPARAESSIAKWWAGEGGHRVSHAVQHLHGGVGADISYPIHRYFLWARQIGALLGSAHEHLALLAAQLPHAGSGDAGTDGPMPDILGHTGTGR